MNKFKVGDRVEDISTGVCGTVFELYKNIVYVDIEDKNHGVKYGGREHVWCLPELSFRLAKPNTYELHITCNDGKTINAVYKVNGKIEKRTEAVCAPSDTFNFNTGAELAINRVLYGTDYNPKDVAFKPTQPIAPQEDEAKFKVGDKVKVIGNCCCHSYSKGTILTLVRSVNFLRREPDWYVGEGTDYVSERDIEPYAEPEKEPEPVYYSGKVVCVETNNGGLTAGRLYEIKDGVFTWNDGYVHKERKFLSFEDFNGCFSTKYGTNKFIPYLGEA